MTSTRGGHPAPSTASTARSPSGCSPWSRCSPSRRSRSAWRCRASRTRLDGETLYPIAVIGMLTAAIVGMVVGGTWADARGPGRPLLVGGLGFSGRSAASPGWRRRWRCSCSAGCCRAWAPAWRSPRCTSPSATPTRPPCGRASSRCSRPRGCSRRSSDRSSPAPWSTCSAGARCSSSSPASRCCRTVFVRMTLRPHLLVRDASARLGPRPPTPCCRHRSRGPARRRSGRAGRRGSSSCSRASCARGALPPLAAPRHAACPARPARDGRGPWRVRRRLRVRGDVHAARAPGRERPLPHAHGPGDDDRRARLGRPARRTPGGGRCASATAPSCASAALSLVRRAPRSRWPWCRWRRSPGWPAPSPRSASP